MDSFCTIVDTNYIPQALALIDSVREHHPEVLFSLLITDIDQPFDYGGEFQVVTPSELGIPKDKLLLMLDFYDSVELATSLKPFLLKYLLSKGADSATFIDPDVLLFSPIDSAIAIARSGSIVLTPHRLSPIKTNDLFYREDTFLRYGIYNLGFLSLNSNSMDALEWWGKILISQSTRYPNEHIYTDQKWADLFPVYFNTEILRDSGMNVAPWNLDERKITCSKNQFFSNDSPLKFVHFSQMSSAVLRGESPNLWGVMLQSTETEMNSLKLLDELTHKYHLILHSKSEGNFMKLASSRANKRAGKSLAYRKYKNSLASRSESQALKVLKRNKFWWLLRNFKVLDGVETYGALLNTIPNDFGRFKSKFRFNSKN